MMYGQLTRNKTSKNKATALIRTKQENTFAERRQNVPQRTNNTCTTAIERSVHGKNYRGVIEAFNSTSTYLDDLLNTDNKYSDGLISQIYLSELHLNKANSSETEAPFLDLHLSILDRFISC